MRKITKACRSFPSNEAVVKVLYLALHQASKKWTYANTQLETSDGAVRDYVSGPDLTVQTGIYTKPFTVSQRSQSLLYSQPHKLFQGWCRLWRRFDKGLQAFPSLFIELDDIIWFWLLSLFIRFCFLHNFTDWLVDGADASNNSAGSFFTLFA